MTEDPSDGVEVNACVDHERGRGMPEIVEMEIGEPCSVPCRIPRPLEVGIGLAGEGVRQQPRASIPPR